MQLTEHFFLEEFACKDENHTPYPVKWIKDRLMPLCTAIEKIRDLTGQPMRIVSGYRTKEYNATIPNAAEYSKHIIGIAVDLRLIGMTKIQLYKAVLNLISQGVIPEGGVGLYNTHVHYDIRGNKVRWNYSNWKI